MEQEHGTSTSAKIVILSENNGKFLCKLTLFNDSVVTEH